MTVSRTSRRSATAIAAAASALALASIAGPAMADTPDQVERPDTFTGAYVVQATPENVVGNDADPEGNGIEGAEGAFVFLTNSDEEIICWDITVTGLGDEEYASPAKTATHIHETPAGENGPPRLAFPDPEGDGDVRTTSGCSEGPFTTGLEGDGGADTGAGFELSQIEADPAAFSADTHTSNSLAGAVRGQLAFSQELLDEANAAVAEDDDDREAPVGGVRTGEGGSASTLPLGLMAAFTVAGAAAGAVALRRRQSA